MTRGKITGVVQNLITVEVDGPVHQNEVGYVVHGETRLMAEVIKFQGKTAYAQVYESTRGFRAGQEVEFTGRLLEVQLGPGLLSKNYDGLQNDLDLKKGVFLAAGDYSSPLDYDQKYLFRPLVSKGHPVKAGDWLGAVQENSVDHKIMVPFDLEESWTLDWIAPEGAYTLRDSIARIAKGSETRELTMVQRWPVKRPIKAYAHKPRPSKIMETGVRIIDTFNPMAEGGTGFIPGPFGCGKTVLQHGISKNAEADIIIFAACGERANEVVEIFTEFPHLKDPRTGRPLMERTIIISNTSNMPVAAREASVYTAMTLAEYYRAMGLKVLLLADSTSRWAQALREMSNRLEELPGPDAFPMDLPAVIAGFYSRAGLVELHNGATGSVTFIGTVSPAGGNLKEPVTENTKKSARCFYALQQARADSKRYPAVDPVDSYSKYLEYPEIQQTLKSRLGEVWIDQVHKARNLVIRSKEVSEQIAILGDDGVPLDYHVTFWKGEVVDFVLMQQDAFDAVDSLTPLERQKYMVDLVLETLSQDFVFGEYQQVAPFFKKIINTFRQMNYQEFKNEEFLKLQQEAGALSGRRNQA